MTIKLVTKRPVESVLWQDYRASETGMIVYYASDPVSEVPIREIPEELESPVQPEPHYESGTFGLYGCVHPKIRKAFYKEHNRHLFFVTKYVGTDEDYRDKVLLTGYYRIVKTADAKKFHLRYCPEYGCIDSEDCVALRAGEVKFLSTEDAMVITDEVLKEWNFNQKLTRQSRIILNQEQTAKLVEYFKSKDNSLEDYLYETKRLQPHDPDGEEEDGEASE